MTGTLLSATVVDTAVALLPTAESAPVTQWGPRLALTAAVVAVMALAVWGMWRGWRARGARQADLPAPSPVPEGVPDGGVAGLYVATTTADDLLDRIVVHGLGHRGRATLLVDPRGVRIDRVGEQALWIPAGDLRAVRLGTGQAQKAYEAGGVILIRWELGPRELETGFRADDPQEHLDTASALSALVPTTEGTP